MNNSEEIDSIIADPSWRFTSLIPERGTALFVRSNRSDIDKYNFVDHLYLSNSLQDKKEFLLSDLMNLNSLNGTQTVHFIWHSAFCGSTLLARSLGLEKKCLSIREPNVLMQLAMFKRNNLDFCRSNAYWHKLLDLSIKLLARTFHQEEIPIIKPSNTMNNLMSDILEMDSGTEFNHLILYSKERDFLISNLKKGSDYHAFCSTLLQLYSMDSKSISEKIKKAPPKIGLQQASMAWRLQIERFSRDLNVHKKKNKKNVATLYFKDWLASPEEYLRKVRNFFGLSICDDVLRKKSVDEIMQRHSKQGEAIYDQRIKSIEDNAIVADNEKEIDDSLNWNRSAEFKNWMANIESYKLN